MMITKILTFLLEKLEINQLKFWIYLTWIMIWINMKSNFMSFTLLLITSQLSNQLLLKPESENRLYGVKIKVNTDSLNFLRNKFI